MGIKGSQLKPATKAWLHSSDTNHPKLMPVLDHPDNDIYHGPIRKT